MCKGITLTPVSFSSFCFWVILGYAQVLLLALFGRLYFVPCLRLSLLHENLSPLNYSFGLGLNFIWGICICGHIWCCSGLNSWLYAQVLLCGTRDHIGWWRLNLGHKPLYFLFLALYLNLQSRSSKY